MSAGQAIHAVSPTSNAEVLSRDKWRSSGLSDEHAAALHLQALDPDETEARGYYRQAALLLPYHDAAGAPAMREDASGVPVAFHRVRYLGEPSGWQAEVEKGRRYEQPAGTLNPVYLPRLPGLDWRAVQADPTVEVWITEGELKAACASSRGHPTVGLGGVDMWRATKRGVSLLPDLAAFKWTSRRVWIIFDSDAAHNPDILRAESQLGAELASRGAEVRVVRLPPGPPSLDAKPGKVGLDDFLVAGGDLAPLLAAAEPPGSGKVRIMTLGAGVTEEEVTRRVEATLMRARDPEYPLLLQADQYVRPRVMQPEWAGGTLLPTGERAAAPTIATLVQHDEVSLRWALVRHVELVSQAAGRPGPGGPRTVVNGHRAVERCAAVLLRNPSKQAPRVRGLLVHPLVRPCGRLIDAPGLDEESGLYVHLGGGAGEAPPGLLPPIPVPDNAEEARRLAGEQLAFLRSLVSDYRFEEEAEEMHRAVVVAALLTMFTRKDLDLAPAFLFVGPERGSGKTTLAAIFHVLATGHHLPVVTLSTNAAENRQQLFSALRASPAAILIDNIAADSELANGDLAAVLTSPMYEMRLYHTQQMGAVPTNVVVFLTGNSVDLDEDLSSRTLPVRFSADRPTSWSHPDWFEWALSVRERARVAVQYIQRAYIQHGEGATGVGDQRFPAWARRVRDPLLWAGALDVGQALLDNADANPQRGEEGALLALLGEHSKGAAFTVGMVAAFLGAGIPAAEADGEGSPGWAMREILREICPAALGRNGAVHLGRLFREKLTRWHNVNGARMRLKRGEAKGRATWRVVVGDDQGKGGTP